MKYLFVIALFLLIPCNLRAQNVNCPVGYQCITQATANDIFAKLNELVVTKDALSKALIERAKTDAVVASAQKLIEDYKQLDVVNGQIIAKHEQVEALYVKTIELYANLVEKLQVQLNKPKSAFQKFVQVLKEIAFLAAGVALGRGL